MKKTIILLLAVLTCSCSSPIRQAQAPAPTPSPDVWATLAATGSSIEASFDGRACTISGPSTLAPGQYVVALVNTSGESAYLYIARNSPGWTWEDVLQDIGTPPSTAATERNIAILASDRLAFGDEVDYRQFTLKIEGEYHIVVQGHGPYWGIWPCGPFFVKADQ